MPNPLVSVLINCYNGEKYLEAAINSVMNQTYKNWEIIFWDNQSTDNSEEIVKKYQDKRFNYFKSQRHTTQYEARNEGLNKCSGDLIAFLDVDDFWQKDAFGNWALMVDQYDDDGTQLINVGYFVYKEWLDKLSSAVKILKRAKTVQ